MDRVSADNKSPKNIILNNLREFEWVSGQALGQIAGISRTAVWKHIKRLQEAGYPIKSSPKLGYLLENMPDSILPLEIRRGLITSNFGQSIEYISEIDSTQKLAKQQAAQGLPEGHIVIAENQYGGRGRRGRKWLSGPGNIAMSIILRPSIAPSEASQISILAGVAIARAIRQSTNLCCWLKWPNDILVRNRKLGGILIELSAEMDSINYLILGIGLNINNNLNELAPELCLQTTSLNQEPGQPITRRDLIQQILREMENTYYLYLEQGFSLVKSQWKELNNTLNQSIVVNKGKALLQGVAEDINQQGALILRDEQGQTHVVTAGDVSLRFQNP